MSTATIAQEEYNKKTGERYRPKKPKDSNILQGDGTFETETQKSIDYIQKKGERYPVVRHDESDVWKVTKLENFSFTLFEKTKAVVIFQFLE